jgi:2-aminoadipate transaminase
MNTTQAERRFAGRIRALRPSCVREIMKVAASRDIISFAGGLPNPRLFPVDELAEASARVLSDQGSSALQYSSSEGYAPLRQYVAETALRRRGIRASAEDILLTNGSQQALDLVGKVFLDPGDVALMESPTYLSAIQAFELCQPRWAPVRLNGDGIDPYLLAECLERYSPKLAYLVPNFQNPTGVCYSGENRCAVAHLLRMYDVTLVEDDPYRELRFEGEDELPLYRYSDQPAVLTGTFSKVLSPALRVGWVYAREDIRKRLVVAKQASDLCSSDLIQRILYECLTRFDLEQHIAMLCRTYQRQRDRMLRWIRDLFPSETKRSKPQGGMFIWVTLPNGVSAEELLAATIRQGIAFAPGRSFYPGKPELNTLRLNFTHASEADMEKGMKILAHELRKMMGASLGREPTSGR